MVLDWLPKDVKSAVENLDLNLSVKTVPEIDILLSKTVLFRGKKFRPMLCFLMGQTFGLDLPRLAPYARAAEFVHAATLAHDDVIDESPVRRNRPTLNARSTNARAVLAGDLLLARVMAELSCLGNIHIIQDLAQTVEEHGDDVIEAARQFGEYLGIAFQMIDDIIDYDAQGEKPFAHDIHEGLVNFVTLEMIENNPTLIEPLQKILGVETHTGVWPWKQSELDHACDQVRLRAQAKLEAAEQTLQWLVEKTHGLGQDSSHLREESIDALRAVLLYLRERVR
ncbi:hypothetical protein EBS43_00450 [bacterium]|nr:hypothetical protein [bacterium]